jgi:hypothetical protein
MNDLPVCSNAGWHKSSNYSYQILCELPWQVFLCAMLWVCAKTMGVVALTQDYHRHMSNVHPPYKFQKNLREYKWYGSGFGYILPGEIQPKFRMNISQRPYCFLPIWSSLFLWLSLRSWKWEQNSPPKCWLHFSRRHDRMSHETELFIIKPSGTSNPAGISLKLRATSAPPCRTLNDLLHMWKNVYSIQCFNMKPVANGLFQRYGNIFVISLKTSIWRL